MEFKVAEKFVSINGEGTKAGQPAVFIRLAGCNLRCSYCDTMWANSSDAPHEKMTETEIADYVKSTGITNVTLTGGEPLMAENVSVVLSISLYHSMPLSSMVLIELFPHDTYGDHG